MSFEQSAGPLGRPLRVLLVYPNLYLMMVPPLSIALFTRALRESRCEVELFDTTEYLSDHTSSPERRIKSLQHRPFDPERDLGWRRRESDKFEEFRRQVEAFRPDLLVVSTVEDTAPQAVRLLETVADLEIPNLVGGVFATAAPEKLIRQPSVRMVAVGEGEAVVREVARRMSEGLALDGVPGLWLETTDGSIRRTAAGPLVDLEATLPDYSLFDARRFMRPMGGRVFKTVPVESYRGCPYTCTFCNSPMQNDLARENGLGAFTRRKSMTHLRDEIRMLVDELRPEYLYFIDDSFLARPDREVKAFVEMYDEFRIPFWFNTRPEQCVADNLALLREVGCDRINIGLEHGNERFRREVLTRRPDNATIQRCLDTLADSGIAFAVNNIIGFPDETRELAFETIEFNRRLRGYDALTVSIFTPYHGTRLRRLAVERGYLDESSWTTHSTSSSILRMPHFTREEIDGLFRTFCMYVRFERDLWPVIRQAESLTPEGDEAYAELADLYRERFFSTDQDGRVVATDGPGDWEDVFGHMSKVKPR